jgi:hypothetical protein
MLELTPKSFNQFEVVLWIVAGIICVIRGRNHPAIRWHAFVAAVAFLLFSASDAVEIQTEAWWRPWWLFVWKAGCVLTFAWLWWTYPRPPISEETDS